MKKRRLLWDHIQNWNKFIEDQIEDIQPRDLAARKLNEKQNETKRNEIQGEVKEELEKGKVLNNKLAVPVRWRKKSTNLLSSYVLFARNHFESLILPLLYIMLNWNFLWTNVKITPLARRRRRRRDSKNKAAVFFLITLLCFALARSKYIYFVSNRLNRIAKFTTTHWLF